VEIRQRLPPYIDGSDFALILFMLVSRSFEEIQVYEAVAERAGVHFERNAVRKTGVVIP